MKKVALSKLFGAMFALALVLSTGLPAAADAPLVSTTGTVVSVTDQVLVLATDKGNLTFDLDKDTIKPASIAVGSRITVSYDSDDKTTDKMDARQIVMSPEATPATPGVTTNQTTPAQETTPSTQEQLPQTASSLTLLVVAGLLLLAGGIMLRKRTR